MKRFNLFVLFVLVASLIVAACGNTSIFSPEPTPTPFPMSGCNAIKDADNLLWFDDSHEGEHYVIPSEGYTYMPYFFAYYHADCVEGYPRVVMATASTDCLNQEIKWETDGGWSCNTPYGWTFQAGGAFLWPRGKPAGYEDPRPIIPEFPIPAPQNNDQQG